MKRFFCTICGHVKRVRQYPNDIRMSDSDVVNQRIGTCARHSLKPAEINRVVNLNIPTRALQNKKRA